MVDVVGEEGDKLRPAHLKHLVNLVLQPPPEHGAGGISAADAELRLGCLAAMVGRVLAEVERRRIAAIASGGQCGDARRPDTPPRSEQPVKDRPPRQHRHRSGKNETFQNPDPELQC